MASTNITTFPGKVGISNANPTHTLAIGSNVYVDDTGSNKLTVTGVISGDGLGISNIQTVNVLGLTDNVTRIGTLETDLDNNSSRISTVSTDLSDNSSRITNLSSNLSDNSSRISTVSTDLSDNSSRISTVSTDLSDNSSRISTVSTDLSDNSSRISTVSTDLSDNSSRITSLESGVSSISGVKTFEDDIILESNLRVNGSLTYANTVNMIVSDPIIELGANNQHTNDLGLVLTRHGNLGNDSNVAIFYDESQDTLKIGYTDNSASETTLTTTATGLDVSITGNVAAAYDTDTTSYLGRAAVGYMGQSDQASFSHLDKNTSANFALKQAASGATHINTPTGQHIRFSVNASEVGRFSGGGDFKVGANKLYVDTSASEVQMYSQATGSTAGPDLVLMRDNPNNGANGDYIGQVRYEGLSDSGTSRLYAKTTGKIKTATNGSESGIIETALRTSGSQRISVRHSGDLFHIKNGTDLQVGEVANLYVDTSTSRVGIGMSNPSYTLDVDGDLNLSTGSTLRINGTPAVFSNWTVSGSDIYRSSGNVGIGTDSPHTIFHTQSNVGANNAWVDQWKHVFDANWNFRFSQQHNIGSSVPFGFKQRWNGGEYSPITFRGSTMELSGNVGIGTASPAAKFDVRGASHDPSIPTVHIGDNTADAGDYGMVNLVRDATSGGSKAHLAFIRNGNTVTAMGFHNNTNTFGIWTSFGGVTTTPRLSIDTAGNVGIGTTSPSQILHLLGQGTGSGPKIRFETLNNGNGDYTVDGTEIGGIQFAADDLTWATQHTSSEIVGIHRNPNYSGAQGDLVFKTSSSQGSNPTEKMRINHDGNVGIGLTNPTYDLDVRGGLAVSSDDNNRMKIDGGGTVRRHYTSGGTNYGAGLHFTSNAIFPTNYAGSYVNNQIDLGTSSYKWKGVHTEYLACGGSGQVPVTFTSSAAWQTAINIANSTVPSNTWSFLLGGSGNSTGSAGVGSLGFYVNNGTGFVMNLNKNGNVGIGTTNPGATLDVNGSMKNNNPCFYARRNATQGTGVYIFNIEQLDSHNAYNPTNGRFTAPIAGRYVFNVWAMSNGATVLYTEFRKNGLRVYNATPYTGNVGSYGNIAGTIVVELVVNDYIDINVLQGAAYGGGNDHNGFCGYMIG